MSTITASPYADRDGRLRGIDCEAVVDSGAYSSLPFSACLEAAQVATFFRDRMISLPTGVAPSRYCSCDLAVSRVARTRRVFALELLLDAVRAGISRTRCADEIWYDPSRCRLTYQETFRQR